MSYGEFAFSVIATVIGTSIAAIVAVGAVWLIIHFVGDIKDKIKELRR